MNNCQERKQPHAGAHSAYRRLVARLPITLRPSLNQQLDQWDALFPFERNRVSTFLDGVASLPPVELDRLTQPLRDLELRMGISALNFSDAGDTLGNASLLARSQYFPDWRRTVEQLFETINAAPTTSRLEPAGTRLVLLVLPAELPFGSSSPWQDWDRRGRVLSIANSRTLVELATRGGAGQPDLATLLARNNCSDPSDLWLIDAGCRLVGLHADSGPAAILSYPALNSFRNQFLAGLNAIPKSLAATDQVIANLRHQDWESAWGNQLKEQPRLRKFVMDVFLSGNGALIFSNAFVEWASSEALRRARPRSIVAHFGIRPKPKPFTGIAIFENQQTISALPDIGDPENSAIDAMILARYIWLTATRYPEHEQTICVCVVESRQEAYVLAPVGSTLPFTRTATSEDLYSWICARMAA